MLSFIKNFLRRPVKFGEKLENFVNVIDTNHRNGKKSGMLFNGYIKLVDFDNRELVIIESGRDVKPSDAAIHVVKFENIVTISRMDDNRLRMWIKVED